MISGFAWRRRLRNILGAFFGALALALLLALIFQAEIPELDWASESVRSLTELPESKQPEYPAIDQPVADEADAGPTDPEDAGGSTPDSTVTDIGGPIPSPPKSQESAMERGHQLLADGDPWKALLAFEEASNAQPNSPDPFYYLGVCYVQLGKYGSAQAQFQRALALDDRHVPSVYGLADALRLSAQTKESVKWYRRYLELSPKGKHRTVAARAIEAFED